MFPYATGNRSNRATTLLPVEQRCAGGILLQIGRGGDWEGYGCVGARSLDRLTSANSSPHGQPFPASFTLREPRGEAAKESTGATLALWPRPRPERSSVVQVRRLDRLPPLGTAFGVGESCKRGARQRVQNGHIAGDCGAFPSDFPSQPEEKPAAGKGLFEGYEGYASRRPITSDLD
jgi:hypothetical protein